MHICKKISRLVFLIDIILRLYRIFSLGDMSGLIDYLCLFKEHSLVCMRKIARKIVYVTLPICCHAGAIAWNGELLCSGSRDRSILQRDLRSSEPSERKLVGHRQEVG